MRNEIDSSQDRYYICGDGLIRRIEGECRRLLDALRNELTLPRAVLAFVNDELGFAFRRQLITDPSHMLAYRPISDGLMGQALRERRTLVYPSERMQFLNVDSRTSGEVVVPIYVGTLGAAVLLIDIFEGEPVPVADWQHNRAIQKFVVDVATLIQSHSVDEKELRRQLVEIVENCRKDTSSVRGYIALRDHDDELIYFWKDEQQIFLKLSLSEGLCGLAFSEGRTINSKNVWAGPLYVASDPTIKSELIIPIKSGNNVIAILNMESDRHAAYPARREEAARKYVSEASPLLEKFLTATWDAGSYFGTALASLIEQGDLHTRKREHEDARGIQIKTMAHIRSKLERALHGEVIIWWDGQDRPPNALEGVTWDNQMEGDSYQVKTTDGVPTFCIYAPVRIYGDVKSIVGVVVKERPTVSMIRLVKQYCRISGCVIDINNESAKSYSLEKTLSAILTKKDTLSLYRVAKAMQAITSSTHCTIFGRARVNNCDYMCVVASTDIDIFTNSKHALFHRIGDEDGDIDHVSMAGKPVTQMLYDSSGGSTENVFAAAEGKMSRWKGQLPEETKDVSAGSLTKHIINPASGVVIGVLRLSRARRRGQRGVFDADCIRRVNLVCETLGVALANSGLFDDCSALGESICDTGR